MKLKLNKLTASWRFTALVVGTGSLLSACGGSDSATAAGATVELSSGLSALPSMSSMLAANSEVATASHALRTSAVTGTAPLLKDLSASNVDTYFYNGALAGLTAWSAAGNSYANKSTVANNYRGAEGYAGGQGACRMAQETGAVFDRMINNGSTACYIKKIPAAVGAPETTFAQAAADKHIRIHVTNNSNGGGEDSVEMYVNVKVHGSDSVGTDVYKASLFFCAGTSGSPSASSDGGPGGLEEFEINKTTGLFTSTSKASNHSATASAYLKQVGAGLAVDLSKSRTALFSGNHSEGGNTNSFRQSVEVTGENKVYTKSFNSGNWGGSNMVNKNCSVASFVGGSMDELRFLAGAFKGLGTNDACANCNWSYSGGTEFQTTNYVSTTSTALYSALSGVDLSTDTFYAAQTISAPDMSALSCAGTPDVELDMDFSLAAVAAVKTSCDGDRLFDSQEAWSMCEGGRQNEYLIWGHHE